MSTFLKSYRLFVQCVSRSKTILFALLLTSSFSPVLSAQIPTPVPVLTWRYDLTHAGQNTNETVLTRSNVNPDSFGKLFSLPVDSTVYAQPLYVPALTMSDGQAHNVLFVATSNDSIYAFDADSNGGANAKPIWQISLLTSNHGAGAGATAVPWQDTGSPDVAPTVGITGTPTINPDTNTMYVVAATKENGVYFSRLHAINITSGAEQPNSPVNITATAAGTGNGSSGGQLAFSALWENQRPALDYYNGYVYIGYGAHGDNGPWHGWLFSYNASTLAQSAVLCLSPNGSGAGLWASGAGMPIDNGAAGGRMFLVTGNGTRSTIPPFDANSEYGESVVALSLANGGLTPIDAFTSFNYQLMNSHDWDLGSGGLLMVPDQQGTHPHVAVQAGKEGRIVVLDRDNLGGYAAGASSNTNALQDISNVIPQAKGFWSTPAYWNGNVYLWAENNVPMLFKMNTGVMDAEPDSQSAITSAFPDPSFSISSSGTQNGIAWAVRSDQFNTNGPAVLYAWEADDLSSTIYESDTNSSRDAAGPANKFSIPIVTNGKVYVAANKEVDVYGLFNGQPTAAAPVITPNGGTFSSAQNVSLSTTTPSASIYYTLDGSTPTPASTLFSGPISVSTDTTIKAIASAPGYVQSTVSTATFNFSTQTPAVTFNPAPGTYLSAQSVTLSDTDVNAKIYFTADGTAPSASSSLYTAPIQVTTSETIKAIAIDPTLQNSNIAIASYVIQSGGSSIDFGMGFSSTAGLTLNGSATATNDTRLQLTNGGLNQAGSVFWNAPISIQNFTTTFEFQLSSAQANGFTFCIQNVAPSALGGSSAGLGYQDIQKSVAIKFNFYDYQNEGGDSTGIYTNGEPPVLPTIDISPSGIQLSSGDSIQAKITYDGTTLTLNLLDLVSNDTFTTSQAINIPLTVGGNTAYVGFTGGTGGLSASQKILTWTYGSQTTAQQPASAPVIAPNGGTFTSTQNVTLSTTTPSATIYYTLDGSTPTTASKVYTTAISIGSTTTVEAIATAQGYLQSAVSSAVFTFASQAPSVSFAPPAGTYTAVQSVALSDTDANAKIYYTIDGSTPSASSTLYAGAIQVSASETINAIAIDPAMQNSAVASAAYVIQLVTTTPSFGMTGSSLATIKAGSSSTSTITITPTGGFTGAVSLACALTTSPPGARNLPTCTIDQSATISGTQPATASLAIKTTGTLTGSIHSPFSRFAAYGGETVAASIFFCFLPVRRRRWQSMIGMVLLVFLLTAVTGCGGVTTKTVETGSIGTTSGSYVITVTGTSGTTAATTTVSFSVQ